MISKRKNNREQIEFLCIEEMVPKDHLLRKIERAVDFNKIYEFVEDLYCEDNGRNSIDPVVLFKMVIIQHVYGIPSLRRTASEVNLNIAYRWFLGYGLLEETPHFSTVSYNFKNRFTTETIDNVFEWILSEIADAGYLLPGVVFVDGTHIKANANKRKIVKKEVPVGAKHYADELFKEVNRDREEHGKKPLKEKEQDNNNDDDATPPNGKSKTVVESTTDPDSGMFVKGEHERQLAYEAHTACDKNGYVLGTIITPGNVHDSVAFDDLYRELSKRFPKIETVVADSAYKTPYIAKQLIDDGRVLSTAYKRPQTMKGGHEWWKYVYDEYYDCIVCPEYNILTYSTTNREGYREYKSNPNDCKNCPTRERCTHSKDCVKTVMRHIWAEYVEQTDDIRYTPKYKELYERRKETIERVFADAKEKHAMRYTPYRGLTQVQNWMRLKFAAMNLKKYATHKWRQENPPCSSLWATLLNVLFPHFKTKIPITA